MLRCDDNLRHLFSGHSVNENTYQQTFLTCWDDTTAWIILKDKDDIEALCPINSSPKYILLPVSRYEWLVLKIKIWGKIWKMIFSKLTLQHFFPKLTSGFLWSQWWKKCYQHNWRMRNPQFYLSGKRPIWETAIMLTAILWSDLGQLIRAISCPKQWGKMLCVQFGKCPPHFLEEEP